MHGGNCLNALTGAAVSEWGNNPAQYRLNYENETRLFGLSRLDQSFLGCGPQALLLRVHAAAGWTALPLPIGFQLPLPPQDFPGCPAPEPSPLPWLRPALLP
jgi:hypothetical protein